MPNIPKELKNFRSLTREVQDAIRFAVDGMSYIQIADKIGVTDVTISLWIGPNGRYLDALKEWKDYKTSQLLKKQEKIGDILAREGRAALERIIKLSRSRKTPPKVRLEALNSILDRAGISRVDRHETTTEFKGLSEEDRHNIYGKVLSLVNNRQKKVS